MFKIKKVAKKPLLIALAILIALGAAGFYWKSSRNNSSNQAAQTQGPEEKLNLDPPTKEDAERVSDNKEEIVAREEKLNSTQQAPASSSTGKTVKPTITYAGQYGDDVEVGGYIGGIFEDGGTCTATFTRGSLVLRKSVKAVKNVNSVDCPVIAAAVSEFKQKGSWGVVLSYSSSTSSGSSDNKQIEVK